VPALQPPAGHREARGFRLMVLGVCASLLPKLPGFGPRPLALMAAGLGRMRIWCAGRGGGTDAPLHGT
jgi:hypothetical protein